MGSSRNLTGDELRSKFSQRAGKGDRARPVDQELFDLGLEISQCEDPEEQKILEDRWRKLKDKKRK